MARDAGLEDLIRNDLPQGLAMTEKAMFGGLAWLIDGHLLVGARGDGMLVRLGKGNDAWALALPDVEPMMMGDRVMDGWVRAGPGLRRRRAANAADRGGAGLRQGAAAEGMSDDAALDREPFVSHFAHRARDRPGKPRNLRNRPCCASRAPRCANWRWRQFARRIERSAGRTGGDRRQSGRRPMQRRCRRAGSGPRNPQPACLRSPPRVGRVVFLRAAGRGRSAVRLR